MGTPVIGAALRRFKQRRRTVRALAEIACRPDGPGQPHGLPSELIVSLTSYPPRFATLAPTLRSLMRQTVQPDRVILWLAEGDDAHLPPEVCNLPGLQVETCQDWQSFKKIVPSLLNHPHAHLVTADDDVHYPADWLEQLVLAVHQGAKVAALRAHRVGLTEAGGPAPYEAWRHNLRAPEQGPLVFPTGVSGVIYAPDVFHPDVTRPDLFETLAPGTDDIWLYWMHRLAGSQPRKIGGRARILEWDGSQTVNLRAGNRQGNGNDRAVAALLDRYGWPGAGRA